MRNREEAHSLCGNVAFLPRSSQLRVHLEYLGFPIANDFKYTGGAPASASVFSAKEAKDEFLRFEGALYRIMLQRLSTLFGVNIGKWSICFV